MAVYYPTRGDAWARATESRYTAEWRVIRPRLHFPSLGAVLKWVEKTKNQPPNGIRQLPLVRKLDVYGGGRQVLLLPSVALPMLAAILSAIAAFVIALVAIIRKRERSIVMLLPLCVGGMVLLLAIGELFE